MGNIQVYQVAKLEFEVYVVRSLTVLFKLLLKLEA